MNTRAQVRVFDALLLRLQREAEKARPRPTEFRRLSEDIAWEFEPLRAVLMGEAPLPDLRQVTTTKG